jgi:uncharacterized protein YcnI
MEERVMKGTLSLAAIALGLIVPVVANAHTTIWPRQSMAGATEKYTIRVPTEGKIATTSADLEAPEGVVIETVGVPAGWKYDLKRKDGHIVGISWQMTIQPGEFAEFTFVARNPRGRDQLVWGLRQNFADGSSTDFTRTPDGALRPTAVVKLTPRPD